MKNYVANQSSLFFLWLFLLSLLGQRIKEMEYASHKAITYNKAITANENLAYAFTGVTLSQWLTSAGT
jgi:hypothetical protein